MNIENYYTERHSKDGIAIQFSRQQASDFAKQVASDFNPIHNIDNKRFCVPGDLLFALVLSKYGLSKKMNFSFTDMVIDGVDLSFIDTCNTTINICDNKEKQYLCVERDGEICTNEKTINALSKAYVEFSGRTFPDILAPLMQQHEVMINPNRPLVIYKSMVIDMQVLEFSKPTLELSNTKLDIDGKRGNVCLEFSVLSNEKIVGKGQKNLVLSGLRPYIHESMQNLVTTYTSML